MKNWLYYFYDIKVDNLHQKNKNYYFSIDNFEYIFFPYVGESKNLDDAYKMSEKILNLGLYCHKFVLNKQLKYYTIIDNIPYVLLKYYPNMDRKIDISDILQFQNYVISFNKYKNNDWKILWENKLDYFEYQVNQFGMKYPEIRKSFGYFSGYAETAISLLNVAQTEKEKLIISHRRINNESTLFDLYNPLNLIFDYRIRDVAEFYKNYFFQKKNILQDIMQILLTLQLNQNEYLLFFIRMIYPSFYFDIVENMIDMDNKKDDRLYNVLNKAFEYENCIKNLYYYLSPYLPNIDWLNINY